MKRLIVGPLLVLAFAWLGACATSNQRAGEGSPELGAVVIQVDNYRMPASNRTVWLVSRSGYRTMLGTVAPSDVATFSAEDVGSFGQYRLVAEAPGGRDIVSQSFYITESTSRIRWNLNANVLTTN